MEMRIVITVCDSAADQQCPVWNGSPIKVHWGYADPSNTSGSENDKRQAFELTRQGFGYRMLQLLMLPVDRLDDAELSQVLNDIRQN